MKFLEFTYPGSNTLLGLGLLLRKSNNVGSGGDLKEKTIKKHKIIGSWAGDAIMIIGNYDDSKLYYFAKRKYKNISKKINNMLNKLKKRGVIIEEW